MFQEIRRIIIIIGDLLRVTDSVTGCAFGSGLCLPFHLPNSTHAYRRRGSDFHQYSLLYKYLGGRWWR